MPSDHSLDMHTDSGMELEDVRFAFGVSVSKVRKRPMAEGYKFSIELPAVLDLLDAVDKGGMKAAEVRQLLMGAVDVLYEDAGCYMYESTKDQLAWCVRDGGCPKCDRDRTRFARYLETMAERWRRWELPEHYPFAAGNAKGLHVVECGVVRSHMPEELPGHKPDDVEPLRAFAHAQDDYGLPHQEPGPYLGHLPFHPMSAEEARAWMAENTGPKGGRRYRRCQHCAPTP